MKKYLVQIGFVLAVFLLILICGQISIPGLKSLPQNEVMASVSQVIATATIKTTTTSRSDQTLNIPIIIYHSVRPTRPEETEAQKRYNISPDRFEEQLTYLKNNGYTTISLDQMVADLERGTTSPITKPVILTFDDGWKNQYEYAFPLLKKYNDTATFYVYTNPIEKDERFLIWSQIKEMSDAGMTIGSHSVYHPYFSKATPAELKKEIFNSKKTLEKHLGKKVSHFATPYGQTSSQIEKLIKEAGYTTGRVTTKKSPITKENLFHLSAFFVPQNLQDFIGLLENKN